MKPFRRLSLANQTAAQLRQRLSSGQWNGSLPGVVRLCALMEVSQTTMRAALRQLETEELIAPGAMRVKLRGILEHSRLGCEGRQASSPVVTWLPGFGRTRGQDAPASANVHT